MPHAAPGGCHVENSNWPKTLTCKPTCPLTQMMTCSLTVCIDGHVSQYHWFVLMTRLPCVMPEFFHFCFVKYGLTADASIRTVNLQSQPNFDCQYLEHTTSDFDETNIFGIISMSSLI